MASEYCPTCANIAHGGECNKCGWVSPKRLGTDKKPAARRTTPKSQPKQPQKGGFWEGASKLGMGLLVLIVLIMIFGGG